MKLIFHFIWLNVLKRFMCVNSCILVSSRYLHIKVNFAIFSSVHSNKINTKQMIPRMSGCIRECIYTSQELIKQRTRTSASQNRKAVSLASDCDQTCSLHHSSFAPNEGLSLQFYLSMINLLYIWLLRR